MQNKFRPKFLNNLGPICESRCTARVRRSERMRLNLSQHTLPSDKPALSDRISEAVDTLKAKLCAEHQPANQTEEILVEELAEQFWRLRRARAMEASLLDSDKVMIPHLTAIQRMMSSAERGFHKALTVLRQLQKDRGSRSESASARGFVPAKSTTCSAEAAQLDQPEPPLAEPSLAEPRLAEPRSGVQSTSPSALGFVPPPCPQDEDIDPADWARAFEARRRVHAKVSS